jgi:hypothetical protein
MTKFSFLFLLSLFLFLLPAVLSGREARDITSDSFEETSGSGLEIHTNPSGVKVFIDGVERGLTPVLIDNPGNGLHNIRLSRDGYKDRIFNVNLFNASRLIVSIKMEEVRGIAIVSVYRDTDSPELLPLNPLIYANVPDDIKLPIVPSNDNKIFLSLPAGLNTIKVRAFGWEDSSINVLVNEDTVAAVDFFMKPAAFKVENITQSRKCFNPMNPGSLGVTEYRFEVSAPGTGAFKLLDSNNNLVYEKQIEQFNTWTVNITWDGRDSSGVLCPEGVYSVVIEVSGVPEFFNNKIELIFVKTKTEISFSNLIFPLSVDSGISGLTLTPLPHVLAQGSYQFSVNLLFGSFPLSKDAKDAENEFAFPFSIGMRISPFSRLELSTVFDIVPRLKNSAGWGVSGSLKYNILNGDNSIPLAFSLAASYSWTSPNGESPLSPGLGAGFYTPVSVELTNISVAFCPAIYWYGPEGITPVLLLSTGVLYHSGWITSGISIRYEFDFKDNSRSRLLAGLEAFLFPAPSYLFFSFQGGVSFQQSIGWFGGAGIGLIY